MTAHNFWPCEFCMDLRRSDPSHCVREVEIVIVIPEDKEYRECNIGACSEHYEDFRRTRPAGEPEHVTH